MSKSVSTNVYKKKTGIENIQAYLESGRSITPLEALSNFGIFRLATAIDTLRKRGLPIETEMKKDPNGKTYARYVLGKASAPKKELKVGARVRVIAGADCRFYRGGDEGAVTDFEGTSVDVLFDKGHAATFCPTNRQWYTTPHELEVI